MGLEAGEKGGQLNSFALAIVESASTYVSCFFFYNCFLSYKTRIESHDFHSFLCHIIINQVSKRPSIKKTVERGHL